jgi:hypothetical protein
LVDGGTFVDGVTVVARETVGDERTLASGIVAEDTGTLIDAETSVDEGAFFETVKGIAIEKASDNTVLL